MKTGRNAFVVLFQICVNIGVIRQQHNYRMYHIIIYGLTTYLQKLLSNSLTGFCVCNIIKTFWSNITFINPPSMVHGDLGFRRFFKRRRIKAYSRRADKTRKIHTTRYRSTALSLVDIGARSLEIIIEDF